MQVKLQGCTFEGNSPGRPLLVADKRRTPSSDIMFFGDESAPEVCTWEGVLTLSPECLSSKVNSIGSNAYVEGMLLTGSDEWLLSTQQVQQPLNSSLKQQ